jgi:2-polyprenyl-3-methyl-5-hydroxy-6-metoxy-1,4-benzoquinol methylase
MNEIKCIFCNTGSNNVVVEENGYKGRKCPQCGLIYVSPRPSFNEIVDLYGHNEAHVSAEAHLSASTAKRLYAKHHLRIIRSFAKGGDLLELGAGAGYFLDEARRAGFAPHGLEFNPAQADFIRQRLGIPCDESPLSTEIFHGKKFDVVYHCDVISHLFDPISDFRTMNEVMKDNSFLIFETGNIGDVDERYFKYFQQFQYPDHLFFFGTQNLMELLERTGFRLETIHRYSITPELFARKLLSKVKSNGKNEVNHSPEDDTEPAVQPASGRQADVHARRNSFKVSVKEGLRKAHKYFNYSLRYQIGHIAPKGSRPQTLIVVARKRNEGLGR